MKALLKNNRGLTLIVLIMLMAILASMSGAALLLSRVDLMISGNFKRGTQALYAADAGVSEAVNQLSANVTTSTAQVPPPGETRDIGAGFAYQSNGITFDGIRNEAGFSVGAGTGYNPSGFVFYVYKINMRGTGPIAGEREIEALGAYGPVPK